MRTTVVLAFYIWILNTDTCILKILPDSLESPDVEPIVLRRGRPGMRILSRVLENIEQSEKYSEVPVPEEEVVYDDTDVTKEHTTGRYKRFALDVEKVNNRKWTYGIIPYTFDAKLDDRKRQRIQYVFDTIEYWTHFRFPHWNESLPDLMDLPHRNYLIMMSDASCWSYVGNHMYQNGQKISCCVGGISCMHEIFHAIGFHHEHSNPLRDQYMRVNTENIIDRYVDFFGVRQVPTDRGFGYFDMSSVMAYPITAFSKNKRDVITVYDKEMGYLLQRKDPTGYYLFNEAQTMYRMKEEKCPDLNITCENGGYVSFVNGTCQCRCPKGLDSATHCTDLETTGSSTTCGGMVHLSDNAPIVNIATPGFPDVLNGEHSCVWFITGPTKTILSLDFNEFQVDSKRRDKCDSYLEIRHMLPGQPGVAYCGDGFQRTIVSEVNIISLLLKSESLVKFNVTVKLIKGVCYTNNGRDNSYAGTVNVTEDFQSCLPWSQVTHCRVNTFNVDHMDLEANYCRNPGYGTKPWCYVDAETCARGYCDVCQIKKCFDLFDDCEALVDGNTKFCEYDPEASRGCRQTCGLCRTRRDSTNIQFDGDTDQPAKLYYNTGDVVTYRCRTKRDVAVNTTCTSEGFWTRVPFVCRDGKICADQRTDCIQLLETEPTLCYQRQTFAKSKCAKTCAICNRKSARSCRDNSTAPNTILLSPTRVLQGGVIFRRCRFLYGLSAGDEYRACKPDGTLTGQPPRCISNINAGLSKKIGLIRYFTEHFKCRLLNKNQTDREKKPGKLQVFSLTRVENIVIKGKRDITTESYHVPLRRRKYDGSKNQTLVFHNSLYKIKRSGEITAWKFYSNFPGRVTFQVWTYNYNINRYQLMGENIVEDTKSDRHVRVEVPVKERIPVSYGLLLGIHFDVDSPGGIPFDYCVTEYDPQGAGVVLLKIDNGGVPLKHHFYELDKKCPCMMFSFSAIIGPRSVNSGTTSFRRDFIGYMHTIWQGARLSW